VFNPCREVGLPSVSQLISKDGSGFTVLHFCRFARFLLSLFEQISNVVGVGYRLVVVVVVLVFFISFN
jgi:hypothetical protein